VPEIGAGRPESWGLSEPVKLQPVRKTIPKMQYRFQKECMRMWLIFLEAGLALVLLLGIVYWTMRGKK
jgi:hypothetical protein